MKATPRPSIDAVFPVRGVPQYTYQQRAALEAQVRQYSETGSGMLLVHGPTKSGKSVLVKKLLPKALYIEAPLVETADAFWNAANTVLGTYTGRSAGSETSNSHEVSTTIGFDWIASMKAKWAARAEKKASRGRSATDAANIVVTRELLRTKRTLIIDDFHVLARNEQRRIMQNLKPHVDNGGRVIIIAAGHRAHVIPTLVSNMGGSFKTVKFTLWDDAAALVQIALDGWRELGFTVDDDAIAHRLAENSFGSPQIMQRLSAHLVRSNGHAGPAEDAAAPLVGPTNEDYFYSSTLDELLAEVRWVSKLAKGPKGKPRNTYTTKDGQEPDGYQLIILALRALLPTLNPLASQVQSTIAELTVKATPRPGETTSKLQSMTRMATRPLDDNLSEDELEHAIDGGGVDPVLEFQEEAGATSTVHIVDPFFAYALRWWKL